MTEMKQATALLTAAIGVLAQHSSWIQIHALLTNGPKFFPVHLLRTMWNGKSSDPSRGASHCVVPLQNQTASPG